MVGEQLRNEHGAARACDAIEEFLSESRRRKQKIES